jgi:hypothetical protein
VSEKCLEILKEQTTPVNNRFDSSSEFLHLSGSENRSEYAPGQSSSSLTQTHDTEDNERSSDAENQTFIRKPSPQKRKPPALRTNYDNERSADAENQTIIGEPFPQKRKSPALRTVYDKVSNVLQIRNDKTERLTQSEEKLITFRTERHQLEIKLFQQQIINEKKEESTTKKYTKPE